MNIVIISASVREGRKSHRVALFFKNFISENYPHHVDLVDLNDLQFPIFLERLKYLKNPTDTLLQYAQKIKNADGVLIITPEYNGGYPASLKNAIDVLYDEWYKKPVGIVTVSDGSFGGTQVITSLQFSLWKMKAWTIPAMFPVPRVDDTFDDNGLPKNKDAVLPRAESFLNELNWCMTAHEKMKSEK
jgi:NAD(P)H-dependent FMN reductase